MEVDTGLFCWILKSGNQDISPILPHPRALPCSLWFSGLCEDKRVPRTGCRPDMSWLSHPGFWRQRKVAKWVVSASGTTDEEGFMGKGKSSLGVQMACV